MWTFKTILKNILVLDTKIRTFGRFATPKHISLLYVTHNKRDIYIYILSYCHKCSKTFVPMNFIRLISLNRDHLRFIVLSNELQERTVSGSILILRPFPEHTIDKDIFL